jgi:flagellin
MIPASAGCTVTKGNDSMATIGTNIAAISAANYLNINNNNLTNSIQELSSGSRLANPVNDAAGVAVSGNLQARIDRLNAAVAGVQDVVSYGQTVDGFLSTLQQIATRLSELTQEMTNGAFGSSDRANYTVEASILTGQFSNIYKTADFNGTTLFSGAASASNLVITVDSQGTTDSLQTTGVASSISNVLNTILTIFTGSSSSSLTDNTVASNYIGSINAAITSITTQRAVVNANISKFNFFITNINTQTVNVEAANSRIADLNVAQESTYESQQSILVQAATAMLAQANTSQQNILSLLR